MADLARLTVGQDGRSAWAWSNAEDHGSIKEQQQAVLLLNELLTARASPVEVKTLEGRGRGLIATRDLRPGELLIEEPAVAHVLADKYVGDTCHWCFEPLTSPEKAVSCRKCMSAVWCSTNCAMAARMGHAGECAAIVRARKEGLVQSAKSLGGFRLMSQVLSMCRHEPKMRRSIDLLEHHEEDCPEGIVSSMGQLLKCCDTADGFGEGNAPGGANEDNEKRQQQTKALVGKIHTNVHAITPDLKSVVVGRGMYLVGSMLNHSCRPSCVTSFVGSRLRVHAIEPIAQGQECCIAYTELYRSTVKRRSELKEKKYFTCTCGRCEAMIGAAEEDAHAEGANEGGLVAMSTSSGKTPGSSGKTPGSSDKKPVEVEDEADLDGLACPDTDCDGAYAPLAVDLLGNRKADGAGGSTRATAAQWAPRLRSYCSRCSRSLSSHVQSRGKEKQKLKGKKGKGGKNSKNGNVLREAAGGGALAEVKADVEGLAAEAMVALKDLESRTRSLYVKAKDALEARPRQQQQAQAQQEQQEHLLKCVRAVEAATNLTAVVGAGAGKKGASLTLHRRHVLLFELSNLAVNALWQLRDHTRFHAHADRLEDCFDAHYPRLHPR
jgi:hypothetical protein